MRIWGFEWEPEEGAELKISPGRGSNLEGISRPYCHFVQGLASPSFAVTEERTSTWSS
jgi:hypothetical protein